MSYSLKITTTPDGSVAEATGEPPAGSFTIDGFTGAGTETTTITQKDPSGAFIGSLTCNRAADAQYGRTQ